MIGKVKVTTPNPPCKHCGGMGGYHGKSCKEEDDMKSKEKSYIILCTNCGAPFHGLTACKEDAPYFVKAQKKEDDRIISAIVDILSPLKHKDRDRILAELKVYRSHWFNKEERKI